MRKIYLVESTMFGGRKEENTTGGIYYVRGKGGGRLEKWPYLADKCHASRNNYKLGPFLTKTPRCLGFLVYHILWVYSTNPVLHLYISCYVTVNKPVLSYLSLCLLPQDDIFRYQIWCTKVRKIIEIDLITCNTVHILSNIFRIKPSVSQAFQNNNSLTNV